MMEKPRQGFAGLWNISFGFFGIQIGFALQNANMSRIFQSLGEDIEKLPGLWVAAPLTGLLVQPVIGHMSDRTWLGRLGRRRPYFLAGAILAAIALFVMPESPAIWFAAILSINLGLINLFPIPMLDGGHLLMYGIEAARGRPLTERSQEIAFRFGLAMVLSLMVFATWNDLVHLKIVELVSNLIS